jgi:hypothetical protein
VRVDLVVLSVVNGTEMEEKLRCIGPAAHPRQPREMTDICGEGWWPGGRRIRSDHKDDTF